jgi:branched-chain amino acid aminotransferase
MSSTTIDVHRTTTPRVRPDVSQLGFGKHFADHMLVLEYEASQGWGEPRIEPYGPLSLDPAASCLHYGQAMFEGLKAFRLADDRVALFRIDDHMKRLLRGAPRLSMPTPDPALLRDAILALVSTDRDWVPSAPGTALYIRPVLIGTEPFLGVRPSSRYLLYVITSPVGAYYAAGLKPVKIWV